MGDGGRGDGGVIEGGRAVIEGDGGVIEDVSEVIEGDGGVQVGWHGQPSRILYHKRQQGAWRSQTSLPRCCQGPHLSARECVGKEFSYTRLEGFFSVLLLDLRTCHCWQEAIGRIHGVDGIPKDSNEPKAIVFCDIDLLKGCVDEVQMSLTGNIDLMHANKKRFMQTREKNRRRDSHEPTHIFAIKLVVRATQKA